MAKFIDHIKITSSSQKVIEGELKPLISAVEAIDVSTAKCERGFSFSCMNLKVQTHVIHWSY